MTIKNHYKKAILYPGFFVLGFAILYSLGYSLMIREEKNEHILNWYENLIVNIVTAILYCGVIAFLFLTVFLNKFNAVISNKVLSFLSWFFLPFGFILLTLGKAINELIDLESTWEIMYALVAGLPFAIGLIIQFKSFTKKKTF